MLATLVIFLREGVEASMIVAILLAYLNRIGRRDHFRYVFMGVGAALILATVGGVVAYETVRTYAGSRAQTIFETVTYLLAAAVLTYMTFWMRNHARSLSKDLRARTDAALDGGARWGLALLAFQAVGREGLETVVFTLAIIFSTSAMSALTGALIGFAASMVIAFVIYRLGHKLNLGRFFTIIGVLLMMFLISPLLAVVSLATLPITFGATILIARRSQKQFAAQWANTGALNGHIEEMHTGHAIVKLFGRQEESIERFDEMNEQLYGASFRAQFISGTIQPALNFIANINYVLICVIGGIQVATGRMSLGDVQAFIQYSRQFSMPIIQTASIANVLQSSVASAERVFQLLDEPQEEPDSVTPARLPEVRGRVVLENVSFRYRPDVPLIEDLNLVVEPGRTVAIVGPTGAGKTTLVNLLMRFYEIDGGRITIDGVDTREMTRDDLRTTFGMVLQDTWLFHGTIRENIEYGALGATEERIEAAAAAAHVDHFVRTLPDGYETLVDDDASNASAGEKQLLTIARAFLSDPRILILDEATSSVDTRTEVLIQRAMGKLMRGRTNFVIAHRLSTIRDADTILVMDHGRIIEQGNHEELLARHGFYADLYESQFAEPLAETA